VAPVAFECLVALAVVHGSPRQPEVDTGTTPDRARALAEVAYIFTYPLVVNYGRLSAASAIGTWQPDVAVGNGRPIASIWLDTRTEPWVATCDSSGGLTTCWHDLWGHRIDVPGSLDDEKTSRELVVSPTWADRLPDDIDVVVRGESAFVRLVVDHQSGNQGAASLCETAGEHVELEPLSARAGRPAPPSVPARPWWPYTSESETTEEYWRCANFALSLTATNHLDAALLDGLAAIGVVPGAVWDPMVFRPAIREAIAEGMDAGRSNLANAASTQAARGSGPRSRADFDRDHFARACGSINEGGGGRAVVPDGDLGA